MTADKLKIQKVLEDLKRNLRIPKSSEKDLVYRLSDEALEKIRNLPDK